MGAGNTVTVTWGAGDPASFNVNLTALDDALLDSPENIVLTLTAPLVAEGNATLVAGDESAQLNVTDTDLPPPNILDGAMITNSNVSLQLVTMTWQEVVDPHHAAAKIYDLSQQGQQGSIVQDVGFNIDDSKQYLVGLEAASGTKAIVTDLSLEGVSIQAAGNAQLELNDTAATNSTSTAITAIIDPQTGIIQAKTESTDGTAAGTTIADPTAATVNYLYGAGGNDTLNGSSDADVLNGGPGTDQINGNAGNDLIVYDSLDIMNGGTGIDTVRIDQGALELSLNHASGDPLNTLGPTDNVIVDLRGKSISNVEILLITEEAGASTNAVDPNDNVGTTVQLNAADVFAYSATHDMTVLGSNGDVLQLNLAGGWVQGAQTTDGQNQTTVLYTAGNGATLHVDQQVQVSIV
jgi:hypothetical protein